MDIRKYTNIETAPDWKPSILHAACVVEQDGVRYAMVKVGLSQLAMVLIIHA